MKKKSILFILPSLITGGMEKTQVTLANALAMRGFSVTILALEQADDLKGELDPRICYRYRPYHPHPIGKRLPYLRYKFYDDGMWETRTSAKALYRYYVGKEKFDIEIAFFRGLPIKIISGSTNKDATRLAWVHTDFRRGPGYQNNFSSLKAVRTAYSSFDKIVCVSEEAKCGFIKTIGDTGNLTVVYNPLSVSKIISLGAVPLEKSTRKGTFHLVMVARLLDSVKGHSRLLTAVKRLRDEGNDISLTFVGGGPDEKKIKEKISLLDLSTVVTMTGNQSNPYPYIKEADLLVCASYFEGYNLTVAESLILGVPVISTRCAGPVEILDGGKYGRIVENTDEAIYEGIRDLLLSPETLAEYRKLASLRTPFFDEETIVKKIEVLF